MRWRRDGRHGHRLGNTRRCRGTVGVVRAFLSLMAAVVLAPGHIGSGDSVQARNMEAVITSINPAPPRGVRIDVVGSDTFLRVRANGHTVQIPGYSNEPYMRIEANGDVFVNDGSTTAALNGDRYGNVDLSSFVPSTTPTWRRVSTSGVAMWHDHRSHWMSPKRPATVDDTGRVQDFDIPLEIDGTRTVVSGTLYLRSPASAAWWLTGVVAVLVVALVALWRERLTVVVLTLFCTAGASLGWVQYRGLPDGARITPVLLVFAGGGLVLAIASWITQRRGTPHVSVSLLAGAGVAVSTGVWLVNEYVRASYIPGLSAQWAGRTILPMMLGAGIAATIHGVTKIMRTPPGGH